MSGKSVEGGPAVGLTLSHLFTRQGVRVQMVHAGNRRPGTAKVLSMTELLEHLTRGRHPCSPSPPPPLQPPHPENSPAGEGLGEATQQQPRRQKDEDDDAYKGAILYQAPHPAPAPPEVMKQKNLQVLVNHALVKVPPTPTLHPYNNHRHLNDHRALGGPLEDGPVLTLPRFNEKRERRDDVRKGVTFGGRLADVRPMSLGGGGGVRRGRPHVLLKLGLRRPLIKSLR